MSRLIDADALCEFANNTKGKTVDANDIMRFPTVDAVKHGHWITKSNPNYSPFDPCSSEELHICNQCGHESEFGTRFCPDCGAKMDGERKDDEDK